MSVQMAWLWERYEFDAAKDPERLLCKRCGMAVYRVTMHAALRHGDDVEVLPPVPSARLDLLDAW